MSDKNSSTTLKYMLWAAATLFYAFQYMLRVFPSIVFDDVAIAFNVKADQYSWFTSVYYISYSLLHLPIGYALDRIGPRFILPVCILLAALGNIPLVYSESWTNVVLGRFLIGVGSSAAILGVFKAVRIAFKPNLHALMLGVSVTIGLMGAMYGGKPVAYLIEEHSKIFVVNMFLVLGLALAGLVFLVAPNDKESSAINLNTLRDDVKAIFTNKLVVFTALFGAVMVGPLEGFADVWGPKFLATLYNFSIADGAEATSYIFLGMAVGAILLPYIAEKQKAFYELTSFAGLVMLISFSWILYVALPFTMLSLFCFIIGVMSAYQVLVVHMNGKNVKEDISVMATSLTNMIIMSFGIVFHMSIGSLITKSWDGMADSMTGAPIYTLANFKMGLFVIPLGLLIGCLGMWLVRPKQNMAASNTQPQKEQKKKSKAS